MESEIEYGKKVVTKVEGDKAVEVSRTIIAGTFVPPQRVHIEENIEVMNRAEQDAVYIRFADEEERLRKSGKLIDAAFQIRHTPAAAKRGAHYAVKKFTYLDNSSEYNV